MILDEYRWPLAAALVPAGLLVLSVRGRVLMRALRSRAFATTAGHIQRAWSSEIPGPDMWLRLQHVVYEYRVGDRDYQGTTISHRAGASIAVSGRQLSEGQRVQVWYDPATPEDAVLEQGAGVWDYLLPLGGLVLVALGLAAVITR